MYMRKTLIVSILSAVLIAGCGANPTGYTEDGSTEGTTMATTKPIETTTDIIGNKVSEALDKIEEAKNTALSKIKNAATTTTTTQATTTTTMQESRTIQIDVKTVRGDKNLIFKAVETVPEYNRVKFYFASDEERIILPDRIQTNLVGKSGKVYAYEGGGQLMSEKYGCKQDMAFSNITDFSDLSTVTLTYAFEGYDPVTVTFDIPGL